MAWPASSPQVQMVKENSARLVVLFRKSLTGSGMPQAYMGKTSPKVSGGTTGGFATVIRSMAVSFICLASSSAIHLELPVPEK